MQKIIELCNVFKDYQQGRQIHTVLQGITVNVFAGEYVAVVGPSGNGKSTLLNIITGIDRPSRGSVTVNGTALQTLSEEKLSIWRGGNVGIVFQFFQLLPTLSLLQNVMLPMDFHGRLPKRLRRERALQLLEQVGLVQEVQRLPSEISGGQQQRVAIARALANDPPLIVADEPTGNLDGATADAVFGIFSELREQGKTLVMVTHNALLADAATRKLEIRCGQIENDTLNPSHSF